MKVLSRAPTNQSGSLVEGINWKKARGLDVEFGWEIGTVFTFLAILLQINKTRFDVGLQQEGGQNSDALWCFIPPPDDAMHSGQQERRGCWYEDRWLTAGTNDGGGTPLCRGHGRLSNSINKRPTDVSFWILLKESDGNVIILIFLLWVAALRQYADSLKIIFTQPLIPPAKRIYFFPSALWTNVVDDDRDLQAWDNSGGNNRGRRLCFRSFYHSDLSMCSEQMGAVLWPSEPMLSIYLHVIEPYWYACELLPVRNTTSFDFSISRLHQTIIATRYLKPSYPRHWSLEPVFHSKCQNNKTYQACFATLFNAASVSHSWYKESIQVDGWKVKSKLPVYQCDVTYSSRLTFWRKPVFKRGSVRCLVLLDRVFWDIVGLRGHMQTVSKGAWNNHSINQSKKWHIPLTCNGWPWNRTLQPFLLENNKLCSW